jgi:hypothetical protein
MYVTHGGGGMNDQQSETVMRSDHEMRGRVAGVRGRLKHRRRSIRPFELYTSIDPYSLQ